MGTQQLTHRVAGEQVMGNEENVPYHAKSSVGAAKVLWPCKRHPVAFTQAWLQIERASDWGWRLLTERARDGAHLPELVKAVQEGLIIAAVDIIASALAASRRRCVLGKLREVASKILPSLVVIRVLPYKG